jgi:hypothetical protein
MHPTSLAGMSFNLPLSLFLDLVRCHRRMKRIPSQPMYVPLMQYDNLDEEVRCNRHHAWLALDQAAGTVWQDLR